MGNANAVKVSVDVDVTNVALTIGATRRTTAVDPASVTLWARPVSNVITLLVLASVTPEWVETNVTAVPVATSEIACRIVSLVENVLIIGIVSLPNFTAKQIKS